MSPVCVAAVEELRRDSIISIIHSCTGHALAWSLKPRMSLSLNVVVDLWQRKGKMCCSLKTVQLLFSSNVKTKLVSREMVLVSY